MCQASSGSKWSLLCVCVRFPTTFWKKKSFSKPLGFLYQTLKLWDCGNVFDVDLSAETFDSLTNLDWNHSWCVEIFETAQICHLKLCQNNLMWSFFNHQKIPFFESSRLFIEKLSTLWICVILWMCYFGIVLWTELLKITFRLRASSAEEIQMPAQSVVYFTPIQACVCVR